MKSGVPSAHSGESVHRRVRRSLPNASNHLMRGEAQKQRPHVHTSARQTAARLLACPGALATARSHVRRLTDTFSSSLLRWVSNAYVARAEPSTAGRGCFPPFPRLLLRSTREGGLSFTPASCGHESKPPNFARQSSRWSSSLPSSLLRGGWFIPRYMPRADPE